MALPILRVIAGRAKGRKLKVPPGGETRPSADRVKEALFSSLGGSVAGGRVLDLYAGSGALGIEALSRGAALATFVDDDGRAVETIKANLSATGLADQAEVVHMGVEVFVAGALPQAFDLVVIDPPYELGLPSHVLELLLDRGFVGESSTVVVEASARKLPFGPPSRYHLASEKRYGDSVLVRFQVQEAPS